MVNVWNGLSGKVVAAEGVNKFKCDLDRSLDAWEMEVCGILACVDCKLLVCQWVVTALGLVRRMHDGRNEPLPAPKSFLCV